MARLEYIWEMTMDFKEEMVLKFMEQDEKLGAVDIVQLNELKELIDIMLEVNEGQKLLRNYHERVLRTRAGV